MSGQSANVRFGSLADIRSHSAHVRFTPESGHRSEDISFRKCRCHGSLFREKCFPVSTQKFRVLVNSEYCAKDAETSGLRAVQFGETAPEKLALYPWLSRV